MIKLKKFFICILVSMLIISGYVFAVEVNDGINLISESNDDATDSSEALEPINQDVFIYGQENCSIKTTINGNLFSSALQLLISPDGGNISGDVFAISSELLIASDVTYSDNKDKNGNYIVDTIKSNSVVDGNVYALADSFTIEAGSKINGNLYLVASVVNIEQNASIDGNVFIVADSVNLNGTITGSAYISAKKFTMNYYTNISRDLHLSSSEAFLSGVIYRDAFISVDNTLTTNEDFITYEDLSVNFAKDFTFSGEVKGNAYINAENLSFKNTTDSSNIKCIIKGDLTYASKEATNIPEGIVLGETKTQDYVNADPNKTDYGEIFFNFFSFLIYVFVIILLVTRVTPKCIEKLPKLTIGNAFAGFGIGLLSLLAVLLLFIFLCLSSIGVKLAFFVVVLYLLLIGLSIPLLILNIADVIKIKVNKFVRILLVSAIFYILYLLPVVGGFIGFIVLLTGIGRILFPIVNRKK